MNEDSLYKTKDVGEAAALLTQKQILIKTEQENGAVWFYFSNSNDCTQSIQEFWQHSLMVDAQDYFHSINRIKQIIYERKKYARPA